MRSLLPAAASTPILPTTLCGLRLAPVRPILVDETDRLRMPSLE